MQKNMTYARAMYLGGHAQKEIARTFGVSEQTVSAWKKKMQWPPTPLKPDRADRLKKAFALFRAGHSQQAIARALKVSENTVCTWKKEGNWLARAALLQDKALADALSQIAGAVQADIARRLESGAEASAGALQRALAYVCEVHDRPDLAAPASR